VKTNSAWLLAAALLLPACGPKLVRVPVYTSPSGSVSVLQRHLEEDGEPVARGWQHPAVISDVRLAHILAQLSYEDDQDRPQPVFRSEHVYDLAQGMTGAFANAGPDQEIVASAYSVDRRFGIFTIEKVTSIRAHFETDLLLIEFFALEHALEKDRGGRTERRFEAPAELPESRLPVKLVAGHAITPQRGRGFQVAWRDPVFARPISLSGRGGQLRRRTILLEAEPEEERPDGSPSEPGVAPEPGVAQELRDAQLGALDDLDAQRRAGRITEAEFLERRRLVLDGRLDQAGYGADP
jgi:hypothetical protein